MLKDYHNNNIKFDEIDFIDIGDSQYIDNNERKGLSPIQQNRTSIKSKNSDLNDFC